MEQNSVSINWYPGHMEKAKRQMVDSLKLVDIVIELRDARIPYSSANPMLKEIAHQKPRLIILTKKDKADDAKTKQWVEELNKEAKTIAVCAFKDDLKKIIVQEVKVILKDKLERAKARGIRKKVLRAMVVGIPNVGKSTLINAVVKKRVAKAENRPGVTRALQWIRLNEDVELLDTPGVLWPKFENQTVAKNIALIGSMNDNILDKEDIAAFGLRHLIAHYPQNIKDRYGVDIIEDPYKLLEAIGRSKQWLKKEGEVDLEKTIGVFLKDVRNDDLGKVTWEFCDGSIE